MHVITKRHSSKTGRHAEMRYDVTAILKVRFDIYVRLQKKQRQTARQKYSTDVAKWNCAKVRAGKLTYNLCALNFNDFWTQYLVYNKLK